MEVKIAPDEVRRSNFSFKSNLCRVASTIDITDLEPVNSDFAGIQQS